MNLAIILCTIYILVLFNGIQGAEARPQNDIEADLEPAASGRFLDLGSLFNKYPMYPTRPSYYPGSGGYYPQGGSGGYYPQSGFGGYYPQGGSGGYYPQGGSYPQGGYYPGGGTNILGAGYGGYGGYGGNGGLGSYYGYFDQRYYGRRNLGYGYYPGTNSFGFYRSGYSQPEYVSGFRGYN